MGAKIVEIKNARTNKNYAYNQLVFSLPYDIDMQAVIDNRDEIEKRFDYVLESIIREKAVGDVYLITVSYTKENRTKVETVQITIDKTTSPLEVFQRIRKCITSNFGCDENKFAILNLTKLT